MYAVQGCQFLYHNVVLAEQLRKWRYLATIDDLDTVRFPITCMMSIFTCQSEEVPNNFPHLKLNEKAVPCL
jgi:hypothetical protein